MIIDNSIIKDPDIVHFPKVDNSRLHSIILIFLSILSIYIAIMINQIWVTVFVVIPLLYISKAEEQKQAKRNWIKLVREVFSGILKFIFIISISVFFFFLMGQIGVIIPVIFIIVCVKLYFKKRSTIIRKKFLENRTKCEVF